MFMPTNIYPARQGHKLTLLFSEVKGLGKYVLWQKLLLLLDYDKHDQKLIMLFRLAKLRRVK